MRINPLELDQQSVYKILSGCVVPRPIAWVSTIDAEGVPNLAPFSFFNVVGSNPPALSISITHATERPKNKKDTLHNIEASKQFVVNLVSEDLAEAMNFSSADFPPHINEFAATGLETAPSELVRPPRVAAARASFECDLYHSVPVGEGSGSATLVIGRVLFMHIRGDLLDERYRIDMRALQPVARLAGNDYAYVHETFSLARPKFNPETGKAE